ncbi:MAG: site-2 protease family protein [Clostridiales bacterium]|jgi:Zn-dependent protease|nr:site-2 protease family protein [Clostridiales bacterium]
MLTKSLLGIVLSLPGIILAPAIHEYFKALCSSRQGDPFPRVRGRLRLNPFRHFEPVGFFLLLVFGYGWGNPVETNSSRYKDRKRGTLITYVAPSLMNVLFAFAAASILAISKVVARNYGFPIMDAASALRAADGALASFGPLAFSLSYQMVYYFVQYNLGMAFFNLLPVYPLDCNKILSVFLSPANAIKLGQYEKMLQVILVVLLAFGTINAIFDPIVRFLLRFAL